MKLDAADLRYLTTEEFRVLTAVRFVALKCRSPQGACKTD